MVQYSFRTKVGANNKSTQTNQPIIYRKKLDIADYENNRRVNIGLNYIFYETFDKSAEHVDYDLQ